MAGSSNPRERSGLFRLIARTSSPRSKDRDEPPLLAPADHDERERASREDRAVTGDMPSALRAANDTARAGIGYKGIEQGQRYRAGRSALSVWEVREVVNHAGLPVPHVRLIRVASPKDVKMVSADILRNRRFYKPA
jgi:hypothetical protein